MTDCKRDIFNLGSVQQRDFGISEGFIVELIQRINTAGKQPIFLVFTVGSQLISYAAVGVQLLRAADDDSVPRISCGFKVQIADITSAEIDFCRIAKRFVVFGFIVSNKLTGGLRDKHMIAVNTFGGVTPIRTVVINALKSDFVGAAVVSFHKLSRIAGHGKSGKPSWTTHFTFSSEQQIISRSFRCQR